MKKFFYQNSIYIAIYFKGKPVYGKSLFAKEFAKRILCKDEKEFVQFDNGNHPDFSFIEPDGDSIKIEQIRIVQSGIAVKPIQSDRKIYIINDSEKMTKEAQNCLLKTLEEPPQYAIIILISSNENLLLSTIKSRCTKILFSDISKEDLKRFIPEDMIDLADGSIGRGLQLKNEEELYKSTKQIFENIEKYDKIDFVKNAEIIYKSKDDIQDVLDCANVIFLNKAKQDEKYINCISLIEKTKTKLKQNANFEMSIDELCFSLWEEINENYNRSKI